MDRRPMPGSWGSILPLATPTASPIGPEDTPNLMLPAGLTKLSLELACLSAQRPSLVTTAGEVTGLPTQLARLLADRLHPVPEVLEPRPKRVALRLGEALGLGWSATEESNGTGKKACHQENGKEVSGLH